MDTLETRQGPILIAIDGSPAADAAVEVGLRLARCLGAPARFIHAASALAEDLFAAFPRKGPPAEAILERDPVLRRAAAAAAELGVNAEVEVIVAEPARDLAAGIAGLADGMAAPMIVVGSRGRGAVAGGVLGSVSHNLLKYAAVPVLVVHAPDPERWSPGRLADRARAAAGSSTAAPG